MKVMILAAGRGERIEFGRVDHAEGPRQVRAAGLHGHPAADQVDAFLCVRVAPQRTRAEHPPRDLRAERHVAHDLGVQPEARLAREELVERVGDLDHAEHLGCEEGQAGELQRLAFGQRVAELQHAMVGYADNVACVGVFDLLAALRKDPAIQGWVEVTSRPTLLEAVRHGAFDYIEKPFKADRLLLVTLRAVEASKLQRENRELRRALKERWEPHKKIARWTWPIWIYVSVTGVLIYLLLYQIFPQRPAA